VDSYSEVETARRRDAIIKNMIATPPKKHEPLKDKRGSAKAKPRKPSSQGRNNRRNTKEA